MRVIAGELKGRRLITPQGLDTRPTADKVKEALFSIIQLDVPNAAFLDLFSGSGQMGIEAISRGAKCATLVDSGRQSIECIKQNVSSLGISDKCRVMMRDAKEYLSICTDKFDIVFLDPPYNKGLAQNLLADITCVVKDSAVIICEIEKGEMLPDCENGFNLMRRYKYGKTELAVYRKNPVNQEIY